MYQYISNTKDTDGEDARGEFEDKKKKTMEIFCLIFWITVPVCVFLAMAAVILGFAFGLTQLTVH